MPRIRKAHAGNDSFGNSWDSDGAVVDVPHEEAEQLLAIDDGEFSLAEQSGHDGDQAGSKVDPESGNAAGAGQTRSGDDAEPTPVNPEFSEVNPNVSPATVVDQDAPAAGSEADDAEVGDDDADDKAATPRPAAKKTAARKTAASKPQE